VLHDGVVEEARVEVAQLLERLHELDGVVPLAVQQQLAQEEHVVRVAGVDDARLALQVQHGDVQVAVGEELDDELDDVRLVDVHADLERRGGVHGGGGGGCVALRGARGQSVTIEWGALVRFAWGSDAIRTSECKE